MLKRTPLKRGNTPLKKVSPKKKPKRGFTTEDMWNMFLEIWMERPHKCESCDEYLGELSSYMMDHLLEKSKYPELALNKNNIFLCCLRCHDQKTRGFPTDKHKLAIEQIKKELL